ncbi:SulP family inorganic anion transporter [Marinifilum caeruleilacunae]|uniref:Sulfate permease n=1 Tax=Marinifilum caeruleilacunae TaxID=2499076 RepID=A0ABX1WRB6_9BACT|nr:sulfate permease [Marinifilum caeruleilacunae]NOU58537.1 sulfate permease [Marinifilum caeruleilacunae]
MESIFRPKLFSVLKGYNAQSFQKDLFAGIIVGIVALPLAIAFAVASGVSPEKGLITAIIAGFLISFLGGSRVQIGGPTGAFIVIVYGIVQQYGLEGLMISTFLAGIILVLFGLLRLGAILKFIPHPLIVGFTSGIALVIFSTQIKAAFGLEIAELPSEFIAKWTCYFSHLQSVNVYAILISLATILISIYAGKIIPKVPGSFIAIILMTILVQVFQLPVNTIESMYGEIPNSIGFDMPNIDWSLVHNYFQPALTIAILGAIESLLSAVVADGMIGGNHRSNTELIAQGIANIFSPIFGGIPATGAIARTATNVKNGGRTPIAGIFHALTLLLIMLVFGKWAKLIPMSCLAGILIVVSYNMSEWRTFRSILKGSRFDIIVLLSTFLLTVLVDLTIAIEIGIVLASLIFMYRMSKINGVIPIETDSDDIQNYNQLPKEIEVYEISGPFFFAAAKRYQETLRELKHSTSVLIIRMRHVPFIDATGIRNFTEIIKTLEKRKTKVILSGVNPEVKMELKRSEIAQYLSEKEMCDKFDDALRYAKEIS